MRRLAPLLSALFIFAASPAFGQAFTGPVTGATPTTANHCVKFSATNQLKVVDAGAPCSSGSGTVTSVSLTAPSSILSVAGSPVTTSGTLALSLATQSANRIWSGPTTGAAATPTFRALVGADLPLPAVASLGGVFSKAAVTHNFLTSVSSVDGSVGQAQPACADISDAGTGCSGAASAVGANPSATIGASAVNGVATTFMRSDAAPALPSTLPALNGSALTNLNASALASGTLADARLSANAPLLNAGNVFTVQQTINRNAASCPTAITGTALENCAADGVAARIQNYAWANIAAFTSARANGTAASPTGLVNADQIGGYNSYGWTSAGALAGPAASVRCYATETWSATANGTKCAIATTANTTAVLSDKLLVDNDGATSITSTSALALAVGLNGATNPAFSVDGSTASQVAGLKITGAATGGTVAIAVVDSGSNANLTINAKGSGSVGIGSSSTGNITLSRAVALSRGATITSSATSAAGVTVTGGSTVGVANSQSGQILLSGNTANQGSLSYNGSSGVLDIANTWDNASGVITFRVRTLGTPITPLSLSDTLVTLGVAVTGSSSINAVTGFKFNGTNGINATCTVIPTGITIQGGIITAIIGGTCT